MAATIDSSNLVNLSIVSYVSFAFLFFVLKFKFAPSDKHMWILLFLMISCIAQLVQNLSITASPNVCGASDMKTALLSTLIPWILVFTIFTLLLSMSPGWLRVFSNTFGIFAAEALGLERLVQAVLKKPASNKYGDDYTYLKMIEDIYSDRMTLVVELNLDDVVDKVVDGKNVFNFPALNELEKLGLIEKIEGKTEGDMNNMIKDRRELYNALLLKDNVGYFFWFLLVGIFCVLVSTNSVLSSGCSPKVGKSYNTIFKS
jgi:hypothetical protein